MENLSLFAALGIEGCEKIELPSHEEVESITEETHLGMTVLRMGPQGPDPTEAPRRAMVAAINAMNDEQLKQISEDQEWDTTQLQQDFEVTGFMAPFCLVRRKSDGKKGTLMFRHDPRVYFGFKAD